MYQGDETAVISARVYQREKTPVISPRVYKGDEISNISAWVRQEDETSVILAWMCQKGQRTALDRSQLMTPREDLNLQDEKRGKTFAYVALSCFWAR